MTETRQARLLIIGAPGAGKGTQAARIAERYHVPAISTGDIFRANITAGTQLGQRVQSLIEKGQLVPDELTNEIVADRLQREDAANGFLLDGYPRTVAQVHALDDFVTPANWGALLQQIPEQPPYPLVEAVDGVALCIAELAIRFAPS